MPDRGAPFFFVFPDNEAGSAAARHLREDVPGLSSAAHASGRDWIVGRWGRPISSWRGRAVTPSP